MEVLEACSPKTSGTLICINIIDMENADRVALMEAIDKLIAPYEFTIGADSAVFHLEDNDCPLDEQDDSTELCCEDEGKDGPPYSYQFIVYFDENMKDGYQKYCVQCGEPVGTCKHEKGVWFNDGPEIIRFGSTLIIPYIMEDKTFERVYAEYIGLTNSWRE